MCGYYFKKGMYVSLLPITPMKNIAATVAAKNINVNVDKN
jgi:hypothetical protein